MGKSKGTTTTNSTTLDPQTQQWIQKVYGAAQTAAGAPAVGVDPLVSQAASGYQRGATAGNLGLGALTGDPAALAQLMNPYTEQVTDRIIGDQGRLNTIAMNGVDQRATMSGAFGGSRHGIAAGVALGENTRNAEDQLAQIRSNGFSDAMGRAGGLAALGMQSNAALQGIGAYNRDTALQDRMMPMDILKSSLQGLPYGSTQTQSTVTHDNPWNTVLGAASMFIPGGPLAKLGMGALSGLMNRGGGGASPFQMQMPDFQLPQNLLGLPTTFSGMR